MTLWRDKTKEEEERQKRAQALNAQFEKYQNRGRPKKITLADIHKDVELDSGIISKIMNGHEEFSRPNTRKNLLKIIASFIKRQVMKTDEEANEFLRSGGFEELREEDKREIDHLLAGKGYKDYYKEEEKYTNVNDKNPVVIGLSDPSKHDLLMARISTLNELLTLASKTAPGTQLSELINTQIKDKISNITELFSQETQAIFRWLGVFPNGSSIDLVTQVYGAYTSEESLIQLKYSKPYIYIPKRLDDGHFYEALFFLASYGLIQFIEKIPGSIEDELMDYRIKGEFIFHLTGIENCHWQFPYPIIRDFALDSLKGRDEYEPLKTKYLEYYDDLFKAFIFAKYGYELPADKLKKTPCFVRLSSEYETFYHAMQEMREERQEHIEKELEAKYKDQDVYEETLDALDLPPETLTERQKDLIEAYERKYKNVAADIDCPYPFVDRFWKYLDYEMNPKHFATPNAFALLWGRLAIIHAGLDDYYYGISVKERLINQLDGSLIPLSYRVNVSDL